MTRPVMAIDGPAGSGKSSTARAVAQRLGFAHLDSGALYRALTLAALDQQVPLDDGARIADLALRLPVRLVRAGDGFRPEAAGVDVSEAIRGTRVTEQVSRVAALPAVRDAVNLMLRDAAAQRPEGVVVDGRDIGTVVFPDAGLKVFLTASPEERARRRLLQEGRPTTNSAVAEEVLRLRERDRADSARSTAPLARAPDAHPLDTTGMDFDKQVGAIVALAQRVHSW